MASRFSVAVVFSAKDQISKAMRRMGFSSKRFSQTLRRDFAMAQRSAMRFGATIKTNLVRVFRVGLIGAIGAVGLAIRKVLTSTRQIEDAIAGFTPLMGSTEKAEELVNRLNKTAASTPFQFGALSNTALKVLPLMNKDIDKTIETVRMLGDVSMGSSIKLNSMARGYSRILLKGTAEMESLNIISEAGLNIYPTLKKYLGFAEEEGAAFFDMLRRGEVTMKMVNGAFKVLTSEGGDYFRGMEIASQTLSGRLSTLWDNITVGAAALGEHFLPYLKEYITEMITVLQNTKKWIDSNEFLVKSGIKKLFDNLKKLIETIKAFGKAVGQAIEWVKNFVLFFEPVAPIILGAIIAWKSYKIAVGAAAAAQLIFNAITAAHPFAWILMAIGAVIGAIIVLVKNWEKVKTVFLNVCNFIKDTVISVAKVIAQVLLSPVYAFISLLTLLPGKVGMAFQKMKNNMDNGLYNIDGLPMEALPPATIPTWAKEGTGVNTGFLQPAGERFGTDFQGNNGVIQSKSETTVNHNIIVSNEGTANVETSSGAVAPGKMIQLSTSG